MIPINFNIKRTKMHTIFQTYQSICLLLLLNIFFLMQTQTLAQEFDGWRVMPVRSFEEYQEGLIGGEAEQHNQGMARSRSNPDIIYLSHDCGQIWRSDNAGETWNKTLGKGLYVLAGQSIEVDPVDPKIVFAIMDETWIWMHEEFQGLYRSKDGGDNWEFMLHAPSINSRRFEHNIAYDLTSRSENSCLRWYAAFHNDGLYRSENAGDTWARVSDLTSYGTIYNVQTHPTNGQTVYIGTESGLFVSNTRGTDFQPHGNLPSGEVTSIAVNLENPEELFAVVRGNGLYKSNDGGYSFSVLREFDYALFIFINHGFPNVLYLVGESSYSLVSSDAGETWYQTDTKPAPGLWRDTILQGWKGNISGLMSAVAPNPNDPDEAVAYSRATIWKTTNGGSLFEDQSTLFTGYACGVWNDGMSFDLLNPNRFATFNADVGMAYTETVGDYFYRRGIPIEWRPSIVPWTSMGGGDLQPGTEIIVAAVGDVWNKKLVRSIDSGQNWELVDNEIKNYLFVGFHPSDINVVYTDNKISLNAGESFEIIEALTEYDASILGFCYANPDVIYAMAKPRNKILRSNDRGQTWTLYADAGWLFGLHDSKPTFTVHPTDTTKIYTIDSRGDLAEFDGHTWKSFGLLDYVEDKNPENYVRSVVVDNKNPDIIYAGMHACGIENIWRTQDGGNTWESISFNHPRTSISALFINPHTGELLTSNCYGTWVFPPPYESTTLLYDKCIPRPSCHDGLQNGDETGIDSGGSCNGYNQSDIPNSPEDVHIIK